MGARLLIVIHIDAAQRKHLRFIGNCCRSCRHACCRWCRPHLCFLAGVSLDELDDYVGQAGWRPNTRVVALFFAFVLGFATVFVALGVSASLIGKAITAYFDPLPPSPAFDGRFRGRTASA